MGELTKGMPKSFVEVKGKKLIEYNLERLNEIGVDKIIIVTGYRDDAFVGLTKDMSNIVLKYNPFYSIVNVLGSFYMGMDELDDDFLYLHADTICEKEIWNHLIKFEADVNLPVEFKQCDEEAMKVRSENGKIVQITKQMSLDVAEGEFIGIASFKKEAIESLKQATKEVLSEGEFASYFEGAIQRMIDKDTAEVKAFDIGDNFWVEVDFEEDYIKACNMIKN